MDPSQALLQDMDRVRTHGVQNITINADEKRRLRQRGESSTIVSPCGISPYT
jgi:hypothetical protein